jgi:hypothetical protein
VLQMPFGVKPTFSSLMVQMPLLQLTTTAALYRAERPCHTMCSTGASGCMKYILMVVASTVHCR